WQLITHKRFKGVSIQIIPWNTRNTKGPPSPRSLNTAERPRQKRGNDLGFLRRSILQSWICARLARSFLPPLKVVVICLQQSLKTWSSQLLPLLTVTLPYYVASHFFPSASLSLALFRFVDTP